MSDKVEFTLPVYEGPLDLLLAMIQKAEINIYDIPIASITDQFLDYIHKAEGIGLSDLSEFYKMAAELIYIKSQMMLPKNNIEFDENFVDPREDLVERLLEYSKFRKYSELLLGNGGDSAVLPKRKESTYVVPFADSELWEDVEIKDLMRTFLELIKAHANDVEEEVYNVFESVTEKDKIALMTEILEKRESMMFSELFRDNPTKSHIICSFIAVLEAVKDKMILISQDESFGDIRISRRIQEPDTI